MKVGTYVQELPQLKRRHQRRWVNQMARYGMDGVGWNLVTHDAYADPEVQVKSPYPWRKVGGKYRLDQIRPQWEDRIGWLVDHIRSKGMVSICYFSHWPDYRHQLSGTLPRIPYRWQGKDVTAEDFTAMTSEAKAAWRELYRAYLGVADMGPNKLVVDGTEPFGGSMPMPPNAFNDWMRDTTFSADRPHLIPSMGSQADSEPGNLVGISVNPDGSGGLWPNVVSRIVDTDTGGAAPGYHWQPDGRSCVGLPVGINHPNPRGYASNWFESSVSQAGDQGVEWFLAFMTNYWRKKRWPFNSASDVDAITDPRHDPIKVVCKAIRRAA